MPEITVQLKARSNIQLIQQIWLQWVCSCPLWRFSFCLDLEPFRSLVSTSVPVRRAFMDCWGTRHLDGLSFAPKLTASRWSGRGTMLSETALGPTFAFSKSLQVPSIHSLVFIRYARFTLFPSSFYAWNFTLLGLCSGVLELFLFRRIFAPTFLAWSKQFQWAVCSKPLFRFYHV